jgi:hypothetical protein
MMRQQPMPKARPVGVALFVMLIGILALAGMALLLGAALVGIAAYLKFPAPLVHERRPSAS